MKKLRLAMCDESNFDEFIVASIFIGNVLKEKGYRKFFNKLIAICHICQIFAQLKILTI